KVQLQVYGQVNRAILVTDDGTSTDLYHVDNDNSSTRIGMKGKAKINDDLTAGTKIEVQVESNSTATINQDDESIGANNFTERHLDAYFLSKTWGKFSFGQGDTASNSTSEIDLSGTSVAGYSYAGGMAGGIKFVNPTTGQLSNIDVSDVMTNMDGLSRRDRFRYDTPSFNGFTLSGSLIEDSKRDLALRYSGKMPGAKIAAGAGYAFQDRSATKHQANGSFSVLLDSGFNFTFAGGMRDIDTADRDTPYFFYGKLGYKAKLNSYGSTNFACDYGRYEDIRQDDDTAQLFGVYAVQQFMDAGTELYLGYRWHDLDVPGTEYDAIHAAMLGTRIKF
ncbi:MAG: porin, partial [Desulfobacterales bacterium]|nr:porin [Desulfobacterales bacterium]